MRLQDNDWQGKTEGKSGMFTLRSLNIGPSWGGFLLSFMKSCHHLVLNIECGEWGWVHWLDSDFQACSGRAGAAEERSLKKYLEVLLLLGGALWSLNARPMVAWLKKKASRDAKGQITKSHPLTDFEGRECHICFWVLSIKSSQKYGFTLK